MARTQTIHAQVAKIIRKELKKNGIKAKVRARSASMMTAVDVHIEQDLLPAQLKEIHAFVDQFSYQKGLDITDCPINDFKTDIPQVRFTSVYYSDSKELRQAAWDAVRADCPGYADSPFDVDEATKNHHWEDDARAIYHLIRETLEGDIDPGEWSKHRLAFNRERKQRVRQALN